MPDVGGLTPGHLPRYNRGMTTQSERPVIDASRIDLYGSLITAIQTTLESRGWVKYRVNEWKLNDHDANPVVRFNYAHLEWRIGVTAWGKEEIHSIHVRPAPVRVPDSATVIIEDVLELDKRLASRPSL